MKSNKYIFFSFIKCSLKNKTNNKHYRMKLKISSRNITLLIQNLNLIILNFLICVIVKIIKLILLIKLTLIILNLSYGENILLFSLFTNISSNIILIINNLISFYKLSHIISNKIFLIIFLLLFINIILIILWLYLILNYNIRYKYFIAINNLFKPIIFIIKGIKYINIIIILYYIFNLLFKGLLVEELLLIFYSNNLLNLINFNNIKFSFLGDESIDNSIPKNNNFNSQNSIIRREELSTSNENISNNILDNPNDSDISSLKSDLSEEYFSQESTESFENFNNKSLNFKYKYLKRKFFNKAIEYNIPFLDWFIELLNKNEGNKSKVDDLIETNLNSIQKIERNAQLNNHAFFRIKPFLLNKTDRSPIAYPDTIPVSKKQYDLEDI